MRRKESGRMVFDMSQTTLGKEMRKQRKALGYTLIEASEQSGITAATLSRIEADLIVLPSRETLAAISGAYQMPLETLAQLVYCGAQQTTAAQLSAVS